MTDYKATPDQWAHEERWATESSTAACVLELRARMKNVEENLGFTVKAIAALEELLLEPKLNSKSSPNYRQIRSSDHIGDINKMVNSSAGLTSSLVERVALAIDTCKDFSAWDDDGKTLNWAPEARAAIREVAKWLQEGGDWNQIIVAALLEQEAEHG